MPNASHVYSLTDLHDLTGYDVGEVYILDEWDEETRKFGKFSINVRTNNTFW